MRKLVPRSCAIVVVVVAMTGCGPAHLVQELGYKSDVDKMVIQVKASQQQCKDEMQASDLDPIRQKVELARVLSDRDPPAFALVSNESFPTDAERPVISKWASMRDV
jgi:glutamine synthetase adenylyltransferase